MLFDRTQMLCGALGLIGLMVITSGLSADETAVDAKIPSVKGIPFFRLAVGTWNGSGESVVAGQQGQLSVADTWQAGFVENEGETLFLQEGKIELGNGGEFTYRWVYKLDLERNVILGQMKNSSGDNSLFLVKLSSDGTRISVGPTDSAQKQGMFTLVYFDDEGRYTYESQVRNEEGNPFIQSKVTCDRVALNTSTNTRPTDVSPE